MHLLVCDTEWNFFFLTFKSSPFAIGPVILENIKKEIEGAKEWNEYLFWLQPSYENS